MQLDLQVVGRTLQAPAFTYDWKHCALYALSVGAGPEALDFTWEGSPDFKVYPGFAVAASQAVVWEALDLVRADWGTLVHGEQTLRLHKRFPAAGTLTTTGRIPAVYDKGKAALVLVETETRDEAGDLVAETVWSLFCRGQGGFGGESGPALALPRPAEGAAPAFEVSCPTSAAQALLYRLNGDFNPLHVDPAVAAKAGFPRPILHGLCSYGQAVRLAVTHLCGGDPARLKRFSARFSGVVFPGDTVEMRAVPAEAPRTWLLEARVGERSVLSHGVVEVA